MAIDEPREEAALDAAGLDPPQTATPDEPSTPAPPLEIAVAGKPSDDSSQRRQEAARVFALASERHRNGEIDDAVRGYAKALVLNPASADVYNNLGVALRAQGKLQAAIACYQRSLAMRPNHSDVYSNLGNALRELGHLNDAAANHQQAVHLSPDSSQAIYNLGLVLRDLGHLKEALACFDKALEIDPDFVYCHWDRSLALLLRGDFKEGFAEYDWRWKLPHNPTRGYTQPLWDGASLDGRTIFVHQEQGLGDMIQFVRYLPMVKERGGTVVVECQPELARLISTVRGADKVVIRGSSPPSFDVYVPLLGLPRIFGSSVENIPDRVPYLAPPELHDVHLPVPIGTRLKVGLVWAGKRSHKNDRNRSCALSEFMVLVGLPGVAFYSLQKGEAASELEDVACGALIVDAGRLVEDFADTAAVIAQLDLVIAVDTAVVHLAGALGRPVWAVLPFVSDWRWMIGREDSPWYPTLRLFRQESPRDWEGVMGRVREALRDLAHHRR